MNNLTLIFLSNKINEINSFKKYLTCQKFNTNINFIHNNILKYHDYDVLVTPGNSMCDMTGGFDLAVAIKYKGVQTKLQDELVKIYPSIQRIKDSTYNNFDKICIPLGVSYATKLNTNKILVYTPTMPYATNIKKTANIWLAFSSILNKLIRLVKTNEIKENAKVCIPLLGVGFGNMSIKDTAKQISEIILFYENNVSRHSNHLKLQPNIL